MQGHQSPASSSRAFTLQSTPLNIFPSPPQRSDRAGSTDGSPAHRALRHGADAECKKSLRSIPCSPVASTGSVTALYATFSLATASPRVHVHQPPSSPSCLASSSSFALAKPASAANFLDSLRSKTLLDYKFMREFSLAKSKPMQERNLSRMSAKSVYSMRMAQLALEEEGRSLVGRPTAFLQATGVPTLQDGSSKDDGEVRSANNTDASPITSTSRSPFQRAVTRPNKSYELSSLQQSKADQESPRENHSQYFPTLWTDVTAQPGAPSIRRHPAIGVTPRKKTLVRVSSPRASSALHSSGMPTPKSSVLLWQDLSEFDLRPCHSVSAVTSQHGYLQDQNIPALLESTGYDRTELYALWARFKALCSIATSPKGIDKETFRRGIPKLSVEDQFFIDRLFNILDADGSGILEWQEFVEALSSLEKGDLQTRVAFLFRTYDLNGDGKIHRSEVKEFVLASLLVTPTEEVADVATNFVNKIFSAVGCGDKDVMKIEDALQFMQSHPTADLYEIFGRTMVTNAISIPPSSARTASKAKSSVASRGGSSS